MTVSSWLIRKVIAPAWAWYENSSYIKIAQQLEKESYLSLEERLERQWELLKYVIKESYENCEFYKKKFKAAGFHPNDLKSWVDLKSIPILTKKEIREYGSEMISRKFRKEKLVPRKTSGSTGVSLHFYTSDKEFQFKRGVTFYRDQWSGWRLGDWQARVWGNPEYKKSWRGYIRNYLLERGIYLDTLRIDEQMMKDFAKRILKLRPTLLFGHAHSLFLFAKYWEDNNLPDYSFKGIISTAMVLHQHERTKCEEVFNSKIFDRYGCEEVSLIASECEAHEGLHINTDSLVVEIVDEGEPVSDGKEGKVVVTDLRNTAMPFIRYQVGDMAIASDKQCSCGRTYPLLTKIAGRIADYLITPDGQWVSGISLTENFATLIPGVEQVQIIQDKRDHLLLRIVSGKDFCSQSYEEIQRLIKERFGDKMRYDIEKIDKIQPLASGKYRFAINKIFE